MDQEFAVASVLFAGLCYIYSKRKRTGRQFKVRPINQNRRVKGFYNSIFLPMKEKDPDQFFEYTRMTVPVFKKLCGLVAPKLQKARKLRDSISSEERIAVTLHYLSQGLSLKTTATKYQLGHSTVHYIVKQTCEVILDVLLPIYVSPPATTEKWVSIAKDFQDKWNFPNCLGAMDGKHINIVAPSGGGSNDSIVLLACCDANYKFTLVDVGAYGSQHDCEDFRNSKFGCALETGKMNLPSPAFLPNSNKKLPYALVADEAFPLRSYIMRPYPARRLQIDQRIFNYRLSRPRSVIENTFGILTARWRILRTTIHANVDNIDKIVKAVVCLHNFLLVENGSIYNPRGYVDSENGTDGEWRREADALQSVGRLSANNASRECYSIRDTLCNYFVSREGEVPWQYNKCLK